METGNRPKEPRCPLGSIQPIQMDAEGIKRTAWQMQSILVVSIDDWRLDFVDRQFIERIAGRIYGK